MLRRPSTRWTLVSPEVPSVRPVPRFPGLTPAVLSRRLSPCRVNLLPRRETRANPTTARKMPANPMPFATSCEESGRPLWTPTSSPRRRGSGGTCPHTGSRRLQVELRVFGRAEGHVAVDFILCDERGPNVSPQGIRLRASATRGGTKIGDKPELAGSRARRSREHRIWEHPGRRFRRRRPVTARIR